MQKDITYRDAKPEEAKTLGLVNARAYAYRDNTTSPLEADDGIVSLIEKRMAIKGGWTRVAIAEEKVVGFALTYPRAMNEEQDNIPQDTAQLSFIAVSPEYQRQGIGGNLLDEAIQEARDAGLKWMSLWTDDKDNEVARRLYERKSFKLTGKSREGQEGRYADQVVYQLDL